MTDIQDIADMMDDDSDDEFGTKSNWETIGHVTCMKCKRTNVIRRMTGMNGELGDFLYICTNCGTGWRGLETIV